MAYTYHPDNIRVSHKFSMYVGGACPSNPGPGGAAYVLLAYNKVTNRLDKEKHGSVHIPETTNNRAVIIAVIEGLKQLSFPVTITIWSDSDYLVNTMNRGWKRNANQDLWEELDELIKTKTKKAIFRWRKKGQAKYAVICDKLAKGRCLG